MRGRVAAQGFTILAIAAGGVMSRTNWLDSIVSPNKSKEAATLPTFNDSVNK